MAHVNGVLRCSARSVNFNLSTHSSDVPRIATLVINSCGRIAIVAINSFVAIKFFVAIDFFGGIAPVVAINFFRRVATVAINSFVAINNSFGKIATAAINFFVAINNSFVARTIDGRS